ncbi:MAG: hypothetical protein ACHQJ4_06230 [Ignavibacteria bacterium]
MKILKFTTLSIIIFAFLTSCSLVDRIKEKLSSKQTDKKETTTTEETKEKTKSGGENDLKFYNTYIDVVNKISSAAEDLQKDYISEVPEPKSLRKGSFVMVVSANIQLSTVESLIKQYKRSFYDNGDLAKLTADNDDMKKEIEGDFKATLSSLENYYTVGQKVIGYYNNKDYEKDVSLASGYDDDMKSAYNKYKDDFNKFNSDLKKYRPKRNQRNPDDYSNPDEKAVAVLLNTYENTLEKAEDFYDRFEKFKKGDDIQPMNSAVDALDAGFQSDKNKVESTAFSDKTKYMKYSFEDYFTKTVNEFVSEWKKFSGSLSGKMDERKFNDGYNDVVRYYNYMIDAYNSSINTANSFQVY